MKKNFLLVYFLPLLLFCLAVANDGLSQSDDDKVLKPGEKISLDFVDTEIRSVLKVLSYKTGANIVASPEVKGDVTINLVDVPWEQALDILLRTYGYSSEKEGNIIMVKPLADFTKQKKNEKELLESLMLQTEVIVLKYIDAWDAKKVLDAMLSPRGSIAVLEARGLLGWEFSGGQADASKRDRVKKEEAQSNEAYSKTLIVTDVESYLQRIKQTVQKLDKPPKQVLIETRIIEINRDRLKDLGLDFGTGSTGAESKTITTNPVETKSDGQIISQSGAHTLGDLISPAAFNPSATGMEKTWPFNTGLSFIYQKLTGTKFEIILHALEEKIKTNILSSPSIMALDNQSATIMVGTKYPILKSDVTGSTSTVTTASLDYYQDIGIQLNVSPQINGDKTINMIVHPAVTSYTTTLKSYGNNNQIIAEYPIIMTREAETQILINDGETIVIGGLLRDRIMKEKHSVPIVGDIPILGLAFQRDTTDTEKIDLLIFITASIMKEPTQSVGILKKDSEIGSEEDTNKYLPISEREKEDGEFILKR